VNSAIGAGSTLEAAVEDALVRLGATPEKVTLKKLEDGGPGGLMGQAARPFRVRATWRPEFAPPPPPPPAPRAERPAFSDDESEDRGARYERERPARAERAIGGPRGARGGSRERSGGGGGRPERRERSERPDRADRPRRPSTPYDPSEKFDVDEAFLAKVVTDARWLLGSMGLDAEVAATYDGEEITVALTSETDEELLTGRRGDTRISIQQILSRIVNPRRGPGAHLVVDVNGFLAGRRADLLARARALAQEAVASGQEQLTEPLTSDDRRLVHRALTKDGGVTTESYGDGALKRIAIRVAGSA